MQDDIVRRPPAPDTEQPPIEPLVEDEVRQNPNQDVHENPQAGTEPDFEPEPVQPETTDQPEEKLIPSQPKPTSNFPTGIVATAGIVCLVLVGSATFIGLQKN